VNTGPHGPFNYLGFYRAEQKMTALCDLRKILRAAQARQDGGPLKVSAALAVSTFYGMLGRGAHLKK
jgi:hypothetical protein